MQLVQNNLLMALRTMRKGGVYSIINIFGLTISMATCLLIFQYALFELNYDHFHPNAGRTYRLYASNYKNGELQGQTALTPAFIAPKLKESLAGIDKTVRLVSTRWWFDCTLAYSNGNDYRIYNEYDLYYADPSVFSVFSYPLLKGDPQTALKQPYSIVLSKSKAAMYFGNEEPFGKTLRLKGSGEDHDYLITGIMADPEQNSHLAATIFASISTIESRPDFRNESAYSYIQFTNRSNVPVFEKQLDELVAQVEPPTNGFNTQINVQPVTDIHLYAQFEDDMKAPGNAKTLYFLLIIAVTVLIMAWINYFNLTTARSFARASEVGVRKISGASRWQIGFLFLTETFVFNLTALLCAAALVYFFAPPFYSFIGISVPPYFLLSQGSVGSYVILILLLAGVFISGIFQAVTFSSFNPIKVFKGKAVPANGFSPRKVTVVFQFAWALMLAIAVMTLNRQFNFIRSFDLGIDISNTLVVKAPVNVDSTYRQKLALFKNELQSLAIVNAVSSSSSIPGEAIGWTGRVKNNKEEKDYTFTINVIDPDFIETFQLTLLAGRPFETVDFPLKHFGDKVEPVIVNRKALSLLGYENPEGIIGAPVFWDDEECVVVGVVDDFHQESPRKAIQPQLLVANTGPHLSLKLAKSDGNMLAKTIEQIGLAWKKHFPNNPFDYALLEDKFNEQYVTDDQLAKLFNIFSILSLIISCLGLFALSLFSVKQRSKEISIRKVLGAPPLHLLRLLAQEYLLLILIASVVALPLSFWIIGEWLQRFAFHINPGVSIFLIPIVFVVIVSLLTVTGQTLKVIAENPTKNLKHE